MIVLDEQLLGRSLERAITAWYGGSVQFITELRPNTVIKDEAIPLLLRQQRQPTFVTINERDFWQRVTIDQYLRQKGSGTNEAFVVPLERTKRTQRRNHKSHGRYSTIPALPSP